MMMHEGGDENSTVSAFSSTDALCGRSRHLYAGELHGVSALTRSVPQYGVILEIGVPFQRLSPTDPIDLSYYEPTNKNNAQRAD